MRFKSVERFTLYGGGVVMEFDHGRHRYYVTDKANGLKREPVPGVTTVLSTLARPALVNWAAGQAAEYIQDNLRPGVPLYSRRHRYAGTADIVAEVDGALTLIDIKTSKGVYPEYELQLAAYWQALAEEGWFQGAFDMAVVVKVGKDDGEFNVVPMFDASGFERSFKVFEALLEVYAWRQEREGAR